MDNYQIFVSYRRDGGDALAGRLADRLKAMGYSVFYDVESMRSGTFNTQILQAISQCSDFLLVLPPRALDRCSDPNDWVRREVAYALQCNKNIIPVMMRGFEFPEYLPEDIAKLRSIEGITASSEYFDAVIKRIISFLKSSGCKPDDGTADSRGFQPAIKIPAFLKVSDSSFEGWGNICIKHIDDQHGIYCSLRNATISKSLDDYLEERRSANQELSNKFKYVFQFNDGECIKDYNLYTDFESEVSKIIKNRFEKNGIHDDSFSRQCAECLIIFKDYITYLYDKQPMGYKMTIAELIWLLFEFGHPNQGLYFDCDLQPILKQIFLINDFEKLRGIYYGIELEYFDRPQKRLNKYEILDEVSFTIQLCASTAVNGNLRYESSYNICYFLACVSCLHYLYNLLIDDINFDKSQCIKLAKRIKKYLLINYKYLLQKKLMTQEYHHLFATMIEACDKHCKI